MVSSMEVKVKGGAVGVKRKESFGLRKDCEGQGRLKSETRNLRVPKTPNAESKHVLILNAYSGYGVHA
jgi:hypothetical protein